MSLRWKLLSWQTADEWTKRRLVRSCSKGWGFWRDRICNQCTLIGQWINQVFGELWKAIGRDWSVLFELALWPGLLALCQSEATQTSSFIYSKCKHFTAEPRSSLNVIHTHHCTSTASPSCHEWLHQNRLTLINAPLQWFYQWNL